MNTKPMSKEGRANISAGLKAAWAKRKAAPSQTMTTMTYTELASSIASDAEELGRLKAKEAMLQFLKTL